MSIDGNISDLFFNTDLSAAHLTAKENGGEFAGWDHDKLQEEAKSFLGCLERLGVPVPSVDDLTADFYSRV